MSIFNINDNVSMSMAMLMPIPMSMSIFNNVRMNFFRQDKFTLTLTLTFWVTLILTLELAQALAIALTLVLILTSILTLVHCHAHCHWHCHSNLIQKQWLFMLFGLWQIFCCYPVSVSYETLWHVFTLDNIQQNTFLCFWCQCKLTIDIPRINIVFALLLYGFKLFIHSNYLNVNETNGKNQ